MLLACRGTKAHLIPKATKCKLRSKFSSSIPAVRPGQARSIMSRAAHWSGASHLQDYFYVFSQPETDEERKPTADSVEACPTESIGSIGEDA
jgi:hypothetical protein